ncbi:MAG: hypothetical protein JW991_05470 [Candidatus Pacebacteria bacterium]|nr:hypothetical protein [Candidatus Paceibacterota bacterium]
MKASRHYKRSRLARKEVIRNVRRTLFFGILTLALLIFIIFSGPALLVKLASFLGELRSSSLIAEPNDTSPPAPPQFFNLTKILKDPEFKIEGDSESEAKIIIFLNGRLVKEVTADKEGAFTATITLTGERNEVTLRAEDQAGNQSPESEKTIIFLDQKPPELEIISPEGNEFIWQDKQILFRGQTETEALLFINDHRVILSQTGSFEYNYSLSPGNNLIKIVAEDRAGNSTETEVKINYQP